MVMRGLQWLSGVFSGYQGSSWLSGVFVVIRALGSSVVIRFLQWLLSVFIGYQWLSGAHSVLHH